jgi:hypothetical protein
LVGRYLEKVIRGAEKLADEIQIARAFEHPFLKKLEVRVGDQEWPDYWMVLEDPGDDEDEEEKEEDDDVVEPTVEEYVRVFKEYLERKKEEAGVRVQIRVVPSK